MPTLDTVSENRKIKALFKGPTLSRKTTSWASFPKPIYCFDWDGKIQALLKAGFPIDPKDIKFDTYGSWNVKEAGAQMGRILSVNPYATVVIDSFTYLSDAVIKYCWDNNTSNKKKQVGGLWMPGYEEFNAEANTLFDVVEFIKRLNCHAVLTGHVIDVERIIKEYSALAKEMVDVTVHKTQMVTAGKKLQEKMPGGFNEIWHFDRKGKVDPKAMPDYYILTASDGDNFAASSLPLDREIIFNDRPLFQIVVEQCKKKGVEISA